MSKLGFSSVLVILCFLLVRLLLDDVYVFFGNSMKPFSQSLIQNLTATTQSFSASIMSYLPTTQKTFVSTNSRSTPDIVDWKTYHNEGLGFEIRYPASYGIAHNGGTTDEYPQFFPIKYAGYAAPGLMLEYEPIPDIEREKFIVKSRSFDIIQRNKEDSTIYIYFSNEDHAVIYASCIVYDWDLTILNICNQMLSTIKFTR